MNTLEVPVAGVHSTKRSPKVNVVDQFVRAHYGLHRGGYPPPDPAFDEYVEDVRERDRQRTRSLRAAVTTPVRQLSSLPFQTRRSEAPQGKTRLELRNRCLDSRSPSVPSNSAAEIELAAVPAQKKSVLQHPLPALDDQWYRENPEWIGRPVRLNHPEEDQVGVPGEPSSPQGPARSPPRARPRPAEARNAGRQRPVAIREDSHEDLVAAYNMSRFLEPRPSRDSIMTSQKASAIKIAKEQEQAIHEKLRRNGHEIPRYQFQELIGKGAYGRVFKWYAISSLFFLSAYVPITSSITSCCRDRCSAFIHLLFSVQRGLEMWSFASIP